LWSSGFITLRISLPTLLSGYKSLNFCVRSLALHKSLDGEWQSLEEEQASIEAQG
jgi:hypothetical protein